MDAVTQIPGAAFGEAPEPARGLDRGMGLAIARRTVFRPEDNEDFGRVADRVAAGNVALLGAETPASTLERVRLRNAIACGALLTSGRHLQHGDAGQPARNMELFTNCATAITGFLSFYLLLNGSGVGRSYDDDLIALDWAQAPELLVCLSPAHPDWPGAQALPAGVVAPGSLPSGAVLHRVADSREGWAKAIEILEGMTFRRERGRCLVLDLSDIRRAGAPIAGLQGRPAPGPLPLLRALLAVRNEVIAPARHRDPMGEALQPWEQALLVDHHLACAVQHAGARRAARMATKSWRDPGALRFVRLKRHGGFWTANHSLMVDAEFWARVRAARDGAAADPLTRRARALFDAATACAWANGEPGFINGDRLEDFRTGSAWRKPVGEPPGSARYRLTEGAELVAELSRRAAGSHFPVTTNPCGEVVLHVAGGYCVVADFAPLLACPVPLDSVTPGAVPPAVAAGWDARVEDAVRLGVRFLLRVNRMQALYAPEVLRSNRIGIGPTGLHEWAWLRFGMDFSAMLDPRRGGPLHAMLARLSAAAKAEASAYAAELGQAPPLTVTTVKPAGTTAKLFGLTEGAHLPALRQYLRWVQFQDHDPVLADYAARGYPVKPLASFPGCTAVGFPTMPLIRRIGPGTRLVTAAEAAPDQHYAWLRLLERHWIGAARGNQVSYTLHFSPDRLDLEGLRNLLLRNQPRVRGCALLPLRPGDTAGHEYLPEEEVDADRFAAVLAGIRDPGLQEAVDLERLACSSLCPV